MFNRSHIYRFALPLSILLLLFMNFFLKQANDIKPQDAQCQIEGTSKCIIQRQDKKFSLELSNAPEIEEEIRLLLEYPNSYELSAAWVQGVNMYMGRSALVIENTQSHEKLTVTEALFFLGACSEKSMLWQLVTVYIEPNTEHEIKLYYNFSTHQ
ncbi:MAG: hypothetical protein ACI88A_003087 [Paraglaciecola sp.]|jgi:hypothetical protein